MRCLVTGCAGFIGSHLVDRLLREGHTIVGYDNLSSGRPEFLTAAQADPQFTLVRGDTLDLPHLTESVRGVDMVFHLAANTDGPFCTPHAHQALDQNLVATYNVLEAMRANGVRRIVFSSTGSVYGEPEGPAAPEAAPFPIQTSLYGASKVAAEGLIQAYCEGFGFQSYLFRLSSILGERYTHGHVFDFYRQLRDHPGILQIQGDGAQRLSYLYVADCVEAIWIAISKADARVNIFNLGAGESCPVDDSIGWICEHLEVTPRRVYAGGERGRGGDSPFILLDCTRIRALGWKPTVTIRDGILRTLQFLEQNGAVMETRS